MALVKCRSCGYSGSVGCMPTASCGVLVMLGLSIGLSGVVLFSRGILAGHSAWLRYPVIALTCAAGGIAGIVLVHLGPWCIEWLLAMLNRCPGCGSRKWSFPYTEGFGL
jgi:hypothetical protein